MIDPYRELPEIPAEEAALRAAYHHNPDTRQSCANCKFWRRFRKQEAKVDSYGGELGVCAFNPPSSVVIGSTSKTAHVSVYQTGWCGQWAQTFPESVRQAVELEKRMGRSAGELQYLQALANPPSSSVKEA